MKRNCFKCEMELYSVAPEIDSFQIPPSDATCWTSIGNYGSTIFDGGEFTAERLELFICDKCLKEKADLVYFYRLTTEKKVIDLSTFDLK